VAGFGPRTFQPRLKKAGDLSDLIGRPAPAFLGSLPAAPRGSDAIDELFQTWVAKGATVLEEPHDHVCGRTFVVADPDGNLLRGAPVD
jgi:hypothetical protein